MIMEEMESLCLKAIEKNMETYDVYTAEEAFMTGGPFCILPVAGLNGVPVDKGKMGKVTKMLLDKWSANVGVNIMKQIKTFNKELEILKDASAPTPYQFRRD